jgi:DNA-binding winged helix-turn-helix (wHTH) protein/tetratricopeptide (TPR) repeat protein
MTKSGISRSCNQAIVRVRDVMIEPNLVYRIKDFSVHVGPRQIVTPQQTINVRPKTFSLLLKFLESPLQMLPKDILLTEIWDDVAVEEQVLVQSIRELRQLFSPLDVIQTHPRKGYAWVIPVEKFSIAEESPAAVNPPVVRAKKSLPVMVLAWVVLIGLGALAFKKFWQPALTAKNIIAVLPVDNRTDGAGLSWVRLGLMDQMIQSLQFSPEVQVLDVPYVLHLLQVAGVDPGQRMQLVNRIFDISGSSLVVDLELSGSVNDYRLLYRLYTREDQSSGVIIDGHMDNVVARLAKVIASKTDARLDLSHLHDEFNSSLLAEAVEKWNRGDADSAIALLQSAITIEPENFLAHQLLLEYELQLGDWQSVITNAERIIAVAGQGKYDKSYVFYYLLAKAEFAQGNLAQARHSLSRAQQLAEQAFDNLYQAYIASVWGDLELKMGDETSAEGFYRHALGHHQAIACPIGVSMVRLKLIELYALQGKNEPLTEQMNLLKEMVEKHKLPLDLPMLSGS